MNVAGTLREALGDLARGDRAAARARLEGMEAADGLLATLDAVAAAGAAVREGRVDDLVREARRAAASAPRDPAELHVHVGSVLQAAYRFRGDLTLRGEALAALARAADRVEAPDAAVPARSLMATVHLLAGSLHPCLELCDAALDLADARPPTASAGPALAHQFRGYVLFEWNRLDEAREALDRAWALAADVPGVASGVARVQAGLAAARGDPGGVDRWMERLSTIMAGPRTLRNREWLGAVRARITLGAGDLREVDAWLRAFGYDVDALAAADDAWVSSRLHELEGALTLLEATGQWAAVEALGGRVQGAAAGTRRWFEARAASARAVAREGGGRPGEADELWREALKAGREGSFVRAYLEGHAVRWSALRRLADEGDDDAARVLAAAGGAHPPLTPRQLDVLRLVERGLSDKAVARTLGVSVSTVKTHLRGAFERMAVGSRTEAVARARDRGWI